MLSKYTLLILFQGILLVPVGCFRMPGVDDFRLVAKKTNGDGEAVRRDGLYYLTVRDDSEYSHFVLYFYNDNDLALIEFGSESPEERFDKWKTITENVIADKKDMNTKGIYEANDNGFLNIELCIGYPSRGYYFVNYHAWPLNDKIVIQQTGYRKFRSVMKDFPPYFGTLGVEKKGYAYF